MGMNTTFPKRRKSLIVTAVAVAAAGGVAAAVIPAFAAGGTRADHADHSGGMGGQSMVTQSGTVSGGTGGTLLAASLRGANEVPVAGGPAVGDKDGAAVEFIKVKGDKVSVAVTWRGTGKPTMLHIHQGAKGTNGGVKVDFTDLLKKSKRHSVTGTVKVEDHDLLAALTSDPGSFYANLHTAEFPAEPSEASSTRSRSPPSTSATPWTTSRRRSSRASRSTSASRPTAAATPSPSGTSTPCSAAASGTRSSSPTPVRRSGSRRTAAR